MRVSRVHQAGRIGAGLITTWVLGVSSAWAAPVAPPPSSPPSAYTLDGVLQLALERNPAVAGAQALLEQHQGQRLQAGAYPNPTVAGQSGSGSIRDPSSGSSITEYQITLNQPLEWTGKRTARKQAADAGVSGAAAGIEETRLNLVADVKTAFYDLLLAQQSADLAAQNLSIMEDVARIVRVRVKTGEAPQFEAIKADVEVLKAAQLRTRAQNVVRVSRVGLDALTAGSLGSDYMIQGEFDQLPPSLTLEQLSSRASAQHPTLRRLQRLVDRAGLTVVKEQQSRIPDVTVFGGYAREVGREAAVAGLSIPTPLWYLRQGEIASALGTQHGAEADLLRARYDLLKAVNQHFQDAQTTATLIEVYERGLLKQAQEALRIAQFSFRQGAASLLEVLDAQRVQRQLLLDYLQARFDLSVAIARLERAVAGFR